MKVVLLHGAGGGPASLAELVNELSDLEVDCPALPGRPPTGGAPLETVAALAAWVAERIGEERALVAGHSLGGAIALQCAIDHPSRVAALGLIATGARLRVHPSILSALEGTSLATDALDLCRPETPLATARADWHAADRFDAMARLGEVKAATVIIAGADDPLTPPKYARYLEAHIAGAELALLRGAGHFLPTERPVEVAALLRRLRLRALEASP